LLLPSHVFLFVLLAAALPPWIYTLSLHDALPILRAYVFGFISHYLLDRNTNPYIDYLASHKGIDRRKIKLNIDTLIMERTHNLKTWKAPVFKEIDVGFRLNQDIVLLLHQLISKHYPEFEQDSQGYIKKAYSDMKRALKL